MSGPMDSETEAEYERICLWITALDWVLLVKDLERVRSYHDELLARRHAMLTNQAKREQAR